MTKQVKTLGALRSKIIKDPDVILEDHDIMKALIDANERSLGANIVDLRGIAMERLETRLGELEDTHRTVIAAAYENISGMNMIHNAVLKLLKPSDFPSFLRLLEQELPDVLNVARIFLVLESRECDSPPLRGFGQIMSSVEPGAVDHYITAGRNVPVRTVNLREVSSASQDVYGDNAADIRSEALIKLDLGKGHLPGLLVMGSKSPTQFRANQGTDLLGFFGAAFGQVMTRWLD